ncbi:MAG: hypothetical protein ACRCS6_06095 [Turicibacter sp.]
MKDFNDSEAFDFLEKEADQQSAGGFFTPDYNTTYTILPGTKSTKVGENTEKRTQWVAANGAISLINGRSLTQVCQDEDGNWMQNQTIHEILAIAKTAEKLKFEKAGEAWFLGKKLPSDYVAKDDERTFLSKAGQLSLMVKRPLWKVVAA